MKIKNFLQWHSGKNQPRAVVLGIIILVIFSWFYWFQWRPYSIRKACYMITINLEGFKEGLRNDIESGKLSISDAKDKYINELDSWSTKNNFYRACLIEKGLAPESIFVNVK